MMADLIYANGKLWTAVGILATHPGRLPERLIQACQDGLVFVPEPALPSHLTPVYKRVWERVTSCRESQQEGAFAPSIRSLSEEDAVAVANDIIELAYRVGEVVKDDIGRRSRRYTQPGA